MIPEYPAPGRSRVHGRVQAHSTLVAPLSGRRCVAYRLWGRLGTETLDLHEAVPFGLSLTGGRRARIDGRAELVVAFLEGDGELRYRSALLHPWVPPFFGRTFRTGRLPERLSKVLAAEGQDEPSAGVLHELVLESGAGALVDGQLIEPRPGGYRDGMPIHVISTTEDGAPVVIRSRDAPPGT